MGHAKILSKLEDEELIKDLAKKIKEDHLSVRELENIVANPDYKRKNPIIKIKDENKFGYVEETISKEDAAYLVGKIFIETKNADAALISLGDFHGFGKENKFGIQCGIYPGDFHLDRMRTIVPVGSLGTITMSGADILSKQEEGLYLDDPITEESIPYSYVLATKDNMVLEPDKEYTIVMTMEELPKEIKDTMTETWTSADSQVIMEKYFEGYKKSITKDNIYQW